MPAAQDYVDLITSEHADKPNFIAVVTAVCGAFAEVGSAVLALPGDFDLDECVGAQLDVVGEWVGMKRKLLVPLTNVYFSLDTSGLGFDQGSWQGPGNPATGLVTLDDDTYRFLIRAKIAANMWDGSNESLGTILQNLFTGTSLVAFIEDRMDMTYDVCIVGGAPSAVMAAVLRNGLLPIKPGGIEVNGYFMSSASPAPIFGFDVENSNISGFDNGAWATSI